jgi:hypothetical protein
VGAECRNPCLGGFLRATILEGAALDARNALRGWRSDSPAELVAMELPEDAILLRIFIGESDRHRNRPLYEINGFLPVLDDERRACDARKSRGDSLWARKKEARSYLKTAL